MEQQKQIQLQLLLTRHNYPLAPLAADGNDVKILFV